MHVLLAKLGVAYGSSVSGITRRSRAPGLHRNPCLAAPSRTRGFGGRGRRRRRKRRRRRRSRGWETGGGGSRRRRGWGQEEEEEKGEGEEEEEEELLIGGLRAESQKGFEASELSCRT